MDRLLSAIETSVIVMLICVGVLLLEFVLVAIFAIPFVVCGMSCKMAVLAAITPAMFVFIVVMAFIVD